MNCIGSLGDMSIFTISILAIAAVTIFYLVRHVQRHESAHVEAVTAGRPSLTAQEFAAKHFTGASVAVAARCHELFAKNYEFDASRLSPDDKLCDHLLFAAHDCLDAHDFLRDLEHEFDITFSKTEARDMRTMRDIVDAVMAHKRIDRAQITGVG
jgi:acyl carrier protein